MDIILCILWGMIAGLVYILPFLVAKDKKISNQVLALNLLLGWTFVGWVIALVWALKEEEETNKF